MRAQYLRCKISLLLLGLAICFPPTPCRASQSHKSSPEKATALIISAWVLQNSSTDGQAIGNFNDIVQRTVAQNNDTLQIGVSSAWRFLKDKLNDSAGAGYFDPLFYRYVVNRNVADFPLDQARSDIRSASEDYLSNRSNTTGKPSRQSLGFCAADEYCLGYVDLFRPLEPRLTDLLLAFVAANTPLQIVREAAYCMENPGLPYPPATDSRPVAEFQRAMVHCMATNWAAASVDTLGKSTATCQNLTFGNVLHVAQ